MKKQYCVSFYNLRTGRLIRNGLWICMSELLSNLSRDRGVLL
jgi:hypothetical protein